MDYDENDFEFSSEEWESLVLSDLVSVVSESANGKDETDDDTNWSSFYRYVKTQIRDRNFKLYPKDLRKLIPKDSGWYRLFVNQNIGKFDYVLCVCCFDFSDLDEIYDAIQFWTGIRDRAYVAAQSSKFYNGLKGKRSKFCYAKNEGRKAKGIIFLNSKFTQDEFKSEIEKALNWIKRNQEEKVK